jgi:two-component system, chemotaxis family, chemotaxis protein CheY
LDISFFKERNDVSDKKDFDDYIKKNEVSDNKKILIVDDLTYVVKTIERILLEQGYLVITAKTGFEALEKFGKYLPDLITVDQKLPDMTGTQLVEKIKNTEYGKNIKIIFISATSEISIQREILKMKINDYLIKPFEKSKLIATVKRVLEENNE